jgi:glycosyltransferase involved in cell wall biosynthesis
MTEAALTSRSLALPCMGRPRVVILRGTAANPWDLRPWEKLTDSYEITVLVPANNDFDTDLVRLRRVGVRTTGARLQSAGVVGRLAARGIGERYVGLKAALRGADIVHAAELGTWYAAQAARWRDRLGFRLTVTVWETLPFVNAYRNLRTRPYRARVLATADQFLPATERARTALLLEGAPADRIRVVSPGVELPPPGFEPIDAEPTSDGHLVISIGRLVWEKGHQDVLRAVALLRQRGRQDLRVLIVGQGPEQARLQGVIDDLGLSEVAQLRGWIPHDRLNEVYAQGSCLVLASMPTPFWEEQFGMVLIEAMAAGLPICASSSGAIPEVLRGTGALFTPGDWVGLADALSAGPLAGPPIRSRPSATILEHYSAGAAARRLGEAYSELLGQPDDVT